MVVTKLYGILGHPLGHTLSPAMQNAAFRAAGIDALYVALPVEPARIRRALAGLKVSGFSGFNVTVPYKETVLPYLDRISPDARAVGAVNTIVADPRTGRWVGHNTDVYGFQRLAARAGIRTAGRRILLIGAGGAARAVCAAIGGAAASIDIVNRTPARARKLRAAMPKKIQKKIDVLSSTPMSHAYDLIINATSVGLLRGDRLPAPAWIFEKATAAIDLIYNPPRTDFLRRARRAGCRIAGGLDMLLYQGARAFELWTRRPAPVAAMRRALLRK
ncbi:MAG: shikimate dehydrogenase [Candidatus Lindowbacteria bacterium RIFCSPLOWO2_12_FULL_62_27]|nr:MAG: shikimate dehydrogenase [Candidatus Lindowbacteria bacterium RIFCSPLOWO2_12_FULL_62_27]OGH61702.1 MAG: shikimate dehydrogenase [Candidatus Lindowbacteria bacterium RIFCSPLOWO2_02_FULL_62_12]